MSVYAITGGVWALTQTFYGVSSTSDSQFGNAISYAPSGKQVAVGAPYANNNNIPAGMHDEEISK